MTPDFFLPSYLSYPAGGCIAPGGRCGLRLLAGCPGSSHHQGWVANAGVRSDNKKPDEVGLKGGTDFSRKR